MWINEIFFTLSILLANIIQGITGFAGSLLSMPPSIAIYNVETARIAINFYGFLSGLWIVSKYYKLIVWKESIKICIGMFIGMSLGILTFAHIETSLLLIIYSVFIILISLKSLFIKKQINLPIILMYASLIGAGLFQSLFVSGGPLLIIYTSTKLKDKNLIRVTASLAWIFINGIMGITYAVEGSINLATIKIILIGIPALYLGLWIGNKIHSKISTPSFMKLVYILIIFSGCSLLWGVLK